MDSAAAQQHWLKTILTQRALSELSDNPGQFREAPMSGIFRHARREWERSQRGDGLDYMTMPF